MKHVQPDLLLPVDTAVEMDPIEATLIKKAKELYDYDLTITNKSCKTCAHNILVRRVNKCRLFGFRTSKDKVCQKHREA